MKIVRVVYTTKLEYAGHNMQNIRAVAEEVKALGHAGISYSCFLGEDGKTFMHFDQFEDEEAHLVLQRLESFKKFASELEESGWETVPVLDVLGEVVQTHKPF